MRKLLTYIFLTEESQDPKTTTCEKDDVQKYYSSTILNYTNNITLMTLPI